MPITKKWIKENLAKGNFRITVHAAERMEERGIFESDLRCCGRTSKKIDFQDDKGTWKVVGKNLDSEKLTVICSVRDRMLIVTTY